MDALAQAARIEALLRGVPLPAGKEELIEYAAGQQAAPDALGALMGLPERDYRSLDEVGEELARVQPARPRPEHKVPEAESGSVPGGEAYTS